MSKLRKKAETRITKTRIAAVPALPGVYLMKDKLGEVIYVGKAKHLKNRVRSYFSSKDSRINVNYLLMRVASIETLVTEDERQAIILESDLIKKHRPHYNVRLKDDKAYLLVRIDENQDYPRIDLVRQSANDGARYIGPFAFGYELRTLLEVIKRTVPLRTCSDRVLHNRVRPCLEYQIKRCAAPCCFPILPEQYHSWVGQAVELLQGNISGVVEQLMKELGVASAELRYEDAAALRDRIEVLKRISQDRTEVHFGSGSIDAFGVYREGNNLEVAVLMVRQGRLFESKTFGFSDVEVPTTEVLSSLLIQFYESQSVIPEHIVLPIEIEDAEVIGEICSEKTVRTVKVVTAKSGVRARLLNLADRNAKENFEARLSEFSKADRVLKAIQVELQLENMPRVIECIDVSHFQGSQTVASVVSFKDGRPDKSRYRIFHLTQEGKPDDFASMREVTKRHFSRCAEENTLPDLVIIDGGPQQLDQALKTRKELGLLQPALVGLAKKRSAKLPLGAVEYRKVAPKKPERIYLEEQDAPVVLSPESESLHLLERLRDEAHRFAITAHRKFRTRRTFSSALDSVPGIGSKRKQELLRKFKSIKEM